MFSALRGVRQYGRKCHDPILDSAPFGSARRVTDSRQSSRPNGPPDARSIPPCRCAVCLDSPFEGALDWENKIIPRNCMPRFVTDSRPISAQHPITEFYKEEFVKHHLCLQQHRPYFSEHAITDVEAALAKIMNQLEQLCSKDNADQVVSCLLKQFDNVTGLSSRSDPKHTH
jgi:hypothetical protein